MLRVLFGLMAFDSGRRMLTEASRSKRPLELADFNSSMEKATCLSNVGVRMSVRHANS